MNQEATQIVGHFRVLHSGKLQRYSPILDYPKTVHQKMPWPKLTFSALSQTTQFWHRQTIFGLYYKHSTIVNYASSIVNKLEALLTDNARVIIYDRHVFIVQATSLLWQSLNTLAYFGKAFMKKK